ncbi:uncharacterized protein LOC144148978 [Haemaphysalis longicornis]
MRGPGTWAVALAAMVLPLGPCIISSSEVFNLDVAAETYAKETAMRHGSRVAWKDCWYNHSYMLARKLYKPYQLRIQPGLFMLGEPETEVMEPTVVYKQTYTNNQSNEVRATFKQSRQHEETTTITTTSGFECNISASMSVTVKKVVGLGGGLAANFLLHKTEAQTNTTTKTISVEMDITVPPRSEVEVQWLVTDIKKDFPWEMDIAASGYCTIYYDRPVLNHHVQFLPVSYLAWRFPQHLRQLDQDTVLYTSRGNMTSVATWQHRVIVKEVRFHGNQTGGKPTKRTRRPRPSRPKAP